MKDYKKIKHTLSETVETEEELVEEAEWMVHDKLKQEEVIQIAKEQDLFSKSPTSYDSAHNRPTIDVLASFIGDKLKREIEV